MKQVFLMSAEEIKSLQSGIPWEFGTPGSSSMLIIQAEKPRTKLHETPPAVRKYHSNPPIKAEHHSRKTLPDLTQGCFIHGIKRFKNKQQKGAHIRFHHHKRKGGKR